MVVEEIRSEQHFEQIIADNPKVLIDFWAPWCGPCKAMTPTFEQLAAERTEQFKAVKANVDDLPSLAQKYGIRSIPALLMLNRNMVTGEHVGAAPKQEIVAWLDQH